MSFFRNLFCKKPSNIDKSINPDLISDNELIGIMKSFQTCIRRQNPGDLTMSAKIVERLLMAKQTDPNLKSRLMKICRDHTSLSEEQIEFLIL